MLKTIKKAINDNKKVSPFIKNGIHFVKINKDNLLVSEKIFMTIKKMLSKEDDTKREAQIKERFRGDKKVIETLLVKHNLKSAK